jgi:hypothetical protein
MPPAGRLLTAHPQEQHGALPPFSDNLEKLPDLGYGADERARCATRHDDFVKPPKDPPSPDPGRHACREPVPDTRSSPEMGDEGCPACWPADA